MNVQPNYLLELAVALAAALYAGDYFQAKIDLTQTIKTKSSPSDLVTEVDPFCEKLIKETIHRNFREDVFLGEESVAPGTQAATDAIADVVAKSRLWIVDPLDGTSNFVARIPLSVVSIAFSVQGVTQVGVIYDPYRNELFYAHCGLGAYIVSAQEIRNWHAQQVRKNLPPGRTITTSTCIDLHRAVVATGFPVRGSEQSLATRNALVILNQARSFRALGAAALHLAYVAAGRIDLFWEYELNAWDIAAGALLVKEAGGIARPIHDAPDMLRTRHILACGTLALSETFAAVFSNQNLEK